MLAGGFWLKVDLTDKKRRYDLGLGEVIPPFKTDDLFYHNPFNYTVYC